MTEQKRLGQHSVTQQQQDDAREANKKAIVEIADKYFKENPDMFVKWPDTRQKLLKALDGNMLYLSQYKALTKAMFMGVPATQRPIDLPISAISEEKTHE